MITAAKNFSIMIDLIFKCASRFVMKSDDDKEKVVENVENEDDNEPLSGISNDSNSLRGVSSLKRRREESEPIPLSKNEEQETLPRWVAGL